MSKSIQIDHYEILQIVNYNSMTHTCVYKARDKRDDQIVAIKAFDPKDVGETNLDVRRFRREISIISQLKHPHILHPVDHGEVDGSVYYTMRYMEGHTLTHLIRKQSIDLDMVTRIIEQITAALAYAHEKGIVHRDLKPSNIFFDQMGDAYLADFGIATNTSKTTTRLTNTGVLLGTPHYMAPEQWLGDPVDQQTDLYALGVILFEMFTGKLPFEHDDIHALMSMHLYKPPPRIDDMRTDLPAGLIRMIDRALAKAPERRYESANSFLKGYQDALSQTYRLKLVAKKEMFPVTPDHSAQERPLDGATVRLDNDLKPVTMQLEEPYIPPTSKSISSRLLYGALIIGVVTCIALFIYLFNFV